MTSTPGAPTNGGHVRTRNRNGLLVAGSFASASLLGFALLAAVARWLEPDDNARFLALWSLVFGAGAALSAVDAETSRLSSRASMDDRPVGGQVALVAAAGVIGGLLILLVSAFVPGVGPLLRESPAVTLATTAMVVLFVPLCLTRGVLLGTGAVAPYALVVLGEALVRVLVLAALWVALEGSLAAALFAVAAGGLAWLPVVRQVRSRVEWSVGERSFVRAAQAVGALGAANGLATLLLAAYPVFVTTLAGTTDGLQTLFAAVILTRLPLVLVAPLQAVAVPWATRALHGHDPARLRELWVKAATVLVCLVVAGAVAGWLAGPWALRVFQGSDYEAEPWTMALLLAATCVLAVALPQLAVVVAAERHALVTMTWALAVLAAGAWLLWGAGTAEDRGVVAYAAGAVVVYVVSSLALLDATRRPRA